MELRAEPSSIPEDTIQAIATSITTAANRVSTSDNYQQDRLARCDLNVSLSPFSRLSKASPSHIPHTGWAPGCLASASTSGITSNVIEPKRGADSMKRPSGPVEELSEEHTCVTIFFSDIVGFSSWSRQVPPDLVMETLHELYSRLDDVILQELPSLYKVETIGDAYMVASNLLQADPQHAATMIRFAVRAHEEASKVLRPDKVDGSTLLMRCGLHSGPVIAGIVGKIRLRFCLFGDTVSIASQAERTCPNGGIQITNACYQLAKPYLTCEMFRYLHILEQPGTDKAGGVTNQDSGASKPKH
ncbi:hypothetical protein CEUSTIGMA_g9557.t1 [Chlamydomonas eustigma]|uniref:Guanylate cyclase domain-containing protein n=1 Tax=Chlamydomonas eustigma TaxID=1157962 RepID=A0A250XGU0_9CHLO|nr:hypothetical protein CEUSTIGMA_g9557.t1 [Chlamydomonas eustigma]|eukprot:GAX82129.1 hypothetical protein CEUSTIGMA_g9557.t1 [Chlamydomonas eustigma]